MRYTGLPLLWVPCSKQAKPETFPFKVRRQKSGDQCDLISTGRSLHVKVKVSLCWIKQHVVKSCGRVEHSCFGTRWRSVVSYNLRPHYFRVKRHRNPRTRKLDGHHSRYKGFREQNKCLAFVQPSNISYMVCSTYKYVENYRVYHVSYILDRHLLSWP